MQERQNHLIEQIHSVKDENLLIMLEEELSYHLQHKDALAGLKPYEVEELISMAKEPSDKDIISEEEYRAATDKWRTK